LHLFGVLDRYVHSDNPERHAFANRGASGVILTRPQLLACMSWIVGLWAEFVVCERGLPRASLLDSVDEFAGVAQVLAGDVVENLTRRAERPLGYTADTIKGAIFSVTKKAIAAASALRGAAETVPIVAADDLASMVNDPPQAVIPTGFTQLDALIDGGTKT